MNAAGFAKAWPVVRFDEIDSTNEEARRRAIAGDVGPAWLVARSQSAGRGRLRRQWDSPEGNLFATALLSYPASPAQASLASFAAGLAVIDAAKIVGAEPAALRLKWPNDVLADGAKLSGILIETGSAGGSLWMAAGFGVNVKTAPVVPGRETACVTNLPGGAGVTADRFLGALDIAFRARLSRLVAKGFGPTRADWLAKAAYLGERVSVPQGADRVEGMMKDLDDDGALVVELADGSLTHVRAGEISVLG
jgi:BirA family transcriptional regulator, biotin operon repressor / biotin---[acetyl-CoA-carboxylase] ligase